MSGIREKLFPNSFAIVFDNNSYRAYNQYMNDMSLLGSAVESPAASHKIDFVELRKYERKTNG